MPCPASRGEARPLMLVSEARGGKLDKGGGIERSDRGPEGTSEGAEAWKKYTRRLAYVVCLTLTGLLHTSSVLRRF